ncbi:MAG: hypothetical protein ABI134_31470 [Byssovorax sp.]
MRSAEQLLALRANVERKSKSSSTSKTEKTDEGAAGAGAVTALLSPYEQRLCASKGWDPAAYAAHKQQTTGGAPAKSA